MDPNITWFGFPAVLIVMALVEVFKGVGFPDKYAAVLAVFLGTTLSIIAYVFRENAIVTAGIGGLVVGLVASGVWSFVKNGGLNPPSNKPPTQ